MLPVHEPLLRLSDPVTQLRGVGAALAQRLAALGIERLQDLLFHLPSRYEDRTRLTPIAALRPGEPALVQGTVEGVDAGVGRRRSLIALVHDGTAPVRLRLFHYGRAQAEALRRGVRLRCFGEPRRGPFGLEFVHPEYRLLPGDGDVDPPLACHYTPVYPTVEGLSQARLRGLVEQALTLLAAGAGDSGDSLELLPESVRKANRLPALGPALALVHRPPPELPLAALGARQHPTQRRLAFEELLAQNLAVAALRRRSATDRAPALAGNGRLVGMLGRNLPFALTRAQQRVREEIAADLARPSPMLRLLQGDVGAGKTIVACFAAAQALECDHQVALMAPTELLAEQHARSLRQWLEPLGVPVHALTGQSGRRERKAVLAALAGGTPLVAVGTHALFQGEVGFGRLGLVVIDEQHRFGVDQRLALRAKGAEDGSFPHQLVMTATPIPRTLAMTLYAGLETSVIDELPPGRTPVRTVVIPDTRRLEVIARVAAAAAGGRQVYWVNTLIEESEALEAEAASDTALALAAALPGLRVGLVHGRLPAAEKADVMAAFAAGLIHLLVATTVIEVGVDVPNASLMVIENAERLGLAQIHQLRGRVGRGSAASDCVLIYHPPLSRLGRERLRVLRESTDGFHIAERDLELRGPGELLGRRQAGLAALRIADLARDAALLPQVSRAAACIEREHPERAAALIERWLARQLGYGAA
jgi:ATP-dependent DNA helicase RecG